jgi:hypothetical protein
VKPAAGRRQFSLLRLIFAAFVIVGCGPGRPATYPVRGTIVFADGKPVAWGTVEFYSVEDKIAARGQIQPDGTFKLSTYGDGDGAVAGRHLVSIIQAAYVDRPMQHHHAQSASLPTRYANPQTSGLELTVNSERVNEFKITIEP